MMYARLLLVAGLFGCGGKSPAPATGGSAVSTAPLELTFHAFADAGGTQKPVAMGSTLKTGDRIALSVTVTRPAHIYVVQVFPDGNAGVLFPGPNEDRPITGTQRIPGTGWFELDQVVGEENVYVIASTEALEKADAKVARTVTEVRSTGKAAIQNLDASSGITSGGSAAPKSEGTEGAASELVATRGLFRVESDSSLRATADAQGVAVFRFSFKHDAK